MLHLRNENHSAPFYCVSTRKLAIRHNPIDKEGIYDKVRPLHIYETPTTCQKKL